VTARASALAAALLAIVLVVAQDVVPATSLYHRWQYALVLAICLAVMAVYANRARTGADGVAGRRVLIALAGAAIVAVAGLAAGLLGPDTADVIGTPGTVTPIPALGAAAFFGPADPATIAKGTANVIVRRRNVGELVVGPSSRSVTGESVLYLEPRTAAYVDVANPHGDHLTITQPTNTSFLSPVLLFGGRQRIGALDVPLDTFAVPSQHRVVHALAFSAQQLAEFDSSGARFDASRPGLILSVGDDRNQQLGITLAPSGQDITIAGLRIRATIGTYPALAIAAAPPTWALVAGIALFVGGAIWSVLRPAARAQAAPG